MTRRGGPASAVANRRRARSELGQRRAHRVALHGHVSPEPESRLARRDAHLLRRCPLHVARDPEYDRHLLAIRLVTDTGQAGISRIACPTQQTVELDFNKVSVAWPEFFGGTDGFILEKAAIPDADPTKPDLKEALWFQLDDPLIKIPLVRQAFVYAMDRDAVTKGVPALNDPAAETNQCGPWVPAHGPWCPSTGPFARYGFDPAHADELLTRAG